MKEEKQTPKTDPHAGEVKKWKFVGAGNFMVTLRGAYTKMLHDSMGQATIPERVPPIQVTFNNGYGETTDPLAVEGMLKHPDWGTQFYWHPSMKDQVANFNPELAEPLAQSQGDIAKAAAQARENRKIRGSAPELEKT